MTAAMQFDTPGFTLPGKAEAAIQVGMNPAHMDAVLAVLNIADVQTIGGADPNGTIPVDAIVASMDATLQSRGGGTLAFSLGRYRIAANLDIRSAVVFEPGAVLMPDNGATVTLDGSISARRSTLFDLSNGGLVALNTAQTPVAFPEWWGADGALGAESSTAIQQAGTAVGAGGGGELSFAGLYNVRTQVNVSLWNGVTCTMRPGGAIVTNTGNVDAISGGGVSSLRFTEGFRIRGSHANAISLGPCTDCSLEGIEASGGTNVNASGTCGGVWIVSFTRLSLFNNYFHDNGGGTATARRGADIQLGGNGVASDTLYSDGNRCKSTAVRFNYMCFSVANALHGTEDCSGAKTSTDPATGNNDGYTFGHYDDVPGASHDIAIDCLKLADSGGIGCYLRGCGNTSVGQVQGKNLCQVQDDTSLAVAGVVIGDPTGPIEVGNVNVDTCGKAVVSLVGVVVTDWSKVFVHDVNGSDVTGRPVIELRGSVNDAKISGVNGSSAPWLLRSMDTVARSGLQISDLKGKSLTTSGVELLNCSQLKLSNIRLDTIAGQAVLVHVGGANNDISDVQVDNADTSHGGGAVVLCDTDTSTVRDSVVRGSPSVAFQVNGANSYALNCNGKGSPTPLVAAATTTAVNCPGYNPVGPSNVAVTASPMTFTAPGSPGTLYVKGGTITTVQHTGITLVTGATNVAIPFAPFAQLVITYTVAPTMAMDVQ